MKQLLTVNEAAEFLNLHPGTIYRAIKTGTLPHVRIGRSIRFRQEDLESLNNAPAVVKQEPTVTRAPVTRL